MSNTKNQYTMPIYKLKKDIPLVKAGTLFYYDANDCVLGSIGAGCLKLAWTSDGGCQHMLCADTIVFHANATEDREWFELVNRPEKFVATDIIYNGEVLFRKSK